MLAEVHCDHATTLLYPQSVESSCQHTATIILCLQAAHSYLLCTSSICISVKKLGFYTTVLLLLEAFGKMPFPICHSGLLFLLGNSSNIS